MLAAWYEWRDWGPAGWSWTGTVTIAPDSPTLPRYPNTQLFPRGHNPNQPAQNNPPPTIARPTTQSLTQGAIDWHKARINHADTLLIKLARSHRPNLESVAEYLKHHRRESEIALGIEDEEDW